MVVAAKRLEREAKRLKLELHDIWSPSENLILAFDQNNNLVTVYKHEGEIQVRRLSPQQITNMQYN